MAEGRGRICYGGERRCYQLFTGVQLREGMEVKVMVEGEKVSFVLTYQGRSNMYAVNSSILALPRPEFVPFIQMEDEGDSIEWWIQ
jgi:hypothetical protein